MHGTGGRGSEEGYGAPFFSARSERAEGSAEIALIQAQSPRPPVMSPVKTVASSSPTPLFSPGSLVRVFPDTTPPPHARGGHADGPRFVLRGRMLLLRHSDKQQKETPGIRESACLLRYTISSSLHTLVFCLKIWVKIWSFGSHFSVISALCQ